MGAFQDTWWQQTYQVKSIVLDNVLMLRTMQTIEIYLVSLPPLSASKSPIAKVVGTNFTELGKVPSMQC